MASGGAPGQEWVEVQKVSFTRWANSYLSQRGLQINDISKDLADGVLLINLLELLTDSKLPRYNHKPRIAVQRMANLNVALDFLKAQGFKLINVDAVDIEKGNMKIILGLTWTIIMKYQIQKSAFQPDTKVLSSGGNSSPTETPEEENARAALLKWVNEQTKSYGCPEVKNFTTHFQDGKVLMALTDAMAPGTLDMGSFTSDALSNVTAGLNTAEAEFGIPILVDAETVVSSPDDLGMMAYVSFFQNFKRTHQFHVRPRPEILVEEEETGGVSIASTEPPKESAKVEPPKPEIKVETVNPSELFAGTKIESRSPRKVENLTLKRGQFATLRGADSKHDGDPGSIALSPKSPSSGLMGETGTASRKPHVNTTDYNEDVQSATRAMSSLQVGSSYQSSFSLDDNKHVSPRSPRPFMMEEIKDEGPVAWTMDFPDKFTDVKETPTKSPEQIRQEEEQFQSMVHSEAIQGLPLADSGGYHRAVSDPSKPRVEFTVGCIALANQGFRSKTNPMVGLFEIAGSKLLLVDTTEWLLGDHDPVFSKPLVVRFANDVTDQHKHHRLVVWHVDVGSDPKKPPLISDKNLIGYADIFLPDISAIPAKKVVRLPLNSAVDKQDKKLKQKHSILCIARRYAGLRMGYIENFKQSNVRKGSRVDVHVSVFGQQGRNPLVAIFELGPAKQNMFVLGKTEWVKNAGNQVNFRSRISIYDQGVANSQRWMRVCLFNVLAPNKKVVRAATGSRAPAVCQDKDLVGYRDITMAELLVALQVDRTSLSYPFFGANKLAGKGLFTLRGRIFNEIPDVQFVGINQSWLQNRTGHEIEIGVSCRGLISLEDEHQQEPTNPVAALFQKNERGEFNLVSQTEWLKSEYEPVFTRKFHLYSDLQTPCEYRLNVYDLNMEAFDEQQDLKGNTNYAELPTLTAVDGMLTTEPALVGVVYFNLNQLVMSAAMGGLALPLVYPAMMEQSIVQARGEHALRQAQTRIATLLSRKTSVTLSVQIYHAVASPNLKSHQETPVSNAVCTIPYIGTKEINQKGHEITMRLAGVRLPKFDWNGRGDPMVALLERVKIIEERKEVSVATTTWECPACTFQNKELFLVCEMCGGNKPAALVGAENMSAAKAKPIWQEWKLLGQTEWISDNPDPVFRKQLAVCFDPSEEDRDLRLAVYDVDSTVVTHEDMIGYAEFKLSRLAEWADDRPFPVDLRSDRPEVESLLRGKRSQITICAHLGLVQDERRIATIKEGTPIKIANVRADTAKNTDDELIVTVGGQNLLKLNWNVRNPMLALLKESGLGSGQFDVLINQTEFVAKARGECVFQTPLHIPFDSPQRVLRCAVFDVATETVSFEKDLIGYVDVTFEQLSQVATPFTDRFVRVEGMLIGGAHAAGAPKWQLRVYMQSPDPTLQDGLHKRKSGLCFFVQEKSMAKFASLQKSHDVSG